MTTTSADDTTRAHASSHGDGLMAGELPCVLDVEASGFGRGSYPIEIGFALPDGRSVCTLVQPASHWTHWDRGAADLHGLTRALIEQHGKPAAEVARLMNEHLAGRTVYCDGWAHDYTWIAALFEAAEMVPHFRLRHVRELLDDDDLARWDALCSGARAAMQLKRHRASNDALVLQSALGALLQGRAGNVAT